MSPVQAPPPTKPLPTFCIISLSSAWAASTMALPSERLVNEVREITKLAVRLPQIRTPKPAPLSSSALGGNQAAKTPEPAWPVAAKVSVRQNLTGGILSLGNVL